MDPCESLLILGSSLVTSIKKERKIVKKERREG
jgi:hypothetical protein